MDAQGYQQRDDVLKRVKTFESDELSGEVPIGNGGFGQVIRRFWKERNLEVAEKQLVQYSTDGDRKTLESEACLLARIKHRHVVRLYGIRFTKSGGFRIVMEYLKYGSCCLFFEKNSFTKDTMPLKYRIAVQVAETMAFLHSRTPKQLLHLDLKSANVLLDDKLNVKICDFGLSILRTVSRLTQQSTGTSRGTGGTMTHLAPEHLASSKCKPSTKSDVYSFGIFVWELVTERTPYEYGVSQSALMQQVIGGERPDMEVFPTDRCPPQLVECMRESWDPEKPKRPEFSEICLRIQQIPYDNVDRLVTELLLSMKPQNCPLPSEQSSMPTNTNRQADLRLPGREPWSDFQASSFDFNRSDAHTRAKRPWAAQQPLPGRNQNVSLDSGNESYNSYCQSNSEAFYEGNFEDQTPLVPEVETRSSEGEEASGREGNKYWTKRRVFCCLGILLVLAGIGAAAYFVYNHLKAPATCKVLSNQADYDTITCKPPIGSGSTRAAPGTVCSVKCQTGFGTLNQTSDLTCSSGSWDSQEPACTKLGICPTLSSPANGGSVTCSNNHYQTSVCTFSCPDGSRLRGGSGLGKATCSKDGSGALSWNAQVPYCEKFTTCTALPDPTAGKYACQPTQGDTAYNNGTLCKLNCYNGYAVDGNNAVLCGTSGEWNNTKLFCEQTCPQIAPPVNGGVSCVDKNFVGSVCTFRCNANFSMLGVLRTTCQARSKEWTNKPVECLCPACRGGSNCQYIRTWEEAETSLNKSFTLTPPQTHSLQLSYVGHTIVCWKSAPKSCICRDKPSQVGRQCNAQPTQYSNCRQSLSTLLSMMAFKQLYQLPCDADKMPLPC